MNLQALRRYAIKNGVRVRFLLEPAGECLVNEQGLLKIPSLKGVTDFNVEAMLGSVEQFTIETAQEPPKRQKMTREQLEASLGAGPKDDAAEHE